MFTTTSRVERSPKLAALFAALASVFLTVGLINPVAAAPPQNANQSAASWLASQVNADGALEGFTPGQADYGTTLQGIVGLAAVGAEGPVAQQMLDAVNGDIETAVAPFGGDDPGRLALAILANVALGADPTDAGGADLVARLQASQRDAPDADAGLYGAADPTFDGAFRQGLALLALDSVNVDDPAGEAWLTDQQCDSGAWLAYRADTATACPAVDAAAFSGPDTNSTALALLGLAAQDVTPDEDAEAWLESVRSSSGGWPYFGDATLDADSSSTALVITALRAAGSPDAEGLAALLTFQVPCEAEVSSDIGGLFFQPQPDNSQLPDNFSTTQGLWGLSGVEFPVVDATLADPVEPNCDDPTTTTTTTTTTTSTTSATDPTSTTTSVSSTTAPQGSTTVVTPPTLAASTTSASTTAPPSQNDAAPIVTVAAPAAVPTPTAAQITVATPAANNAVTVQGTAASPSGSLARTGVSPNFLLIGAAGMLGLGAAMLLARRRVSQG